MLRIVFVNNTLAPLAAFQSLFAIRLISKKNFTELIEKRKNEVYQIPYKATSLSARSKIEKNIGSFREKIEK